MLYFNIAFTLFLLSFSIFASDNISKADIDMLFEKHVKESYPSCFTEEKPNPMAAIQEAWLRVNKNNDNSIFQFVLMCEKKHMILGEFSSEEEAKRHLYEHEEYFAFYVGGHWYNNKELEQAWYVFYTKGAVDYFRLQKFNLVAKLLTKASELNPRIVKLLLHEMAQEIIDKAVTLKKLNCLKETAIAFADTYENVLAALKIETSYEDNILLHELYCRAHSLERALEFAQKALRFSHPEGLAKQTFQKASVKLLSQIAAINFELKQYNEAKEILLSFHNLDAENALTLSSIFALEKNWQTSFKYFKDMVDTKETVSLSHSMIIAILDMLGHQSVNDFQLYGKKFVAQMEKANPNLKDSIVELRTHIKNKEQVKTSNTIKKALALQKIQSITSAFNAFDDKYKKLWSKSSQFDDHVDKYLAPINEIAEKIFIAFEKIIKLEKAGHHIDDFSTIMSTCESLDKLFSHFDSKSHRLSQEIDIELRQQKLKIITSSILYMTPSLYFQIENTREQRHMEPRKAKIKTKKSSSCDKKISSPKTTTKDDKRQDQCSLKSFKDISLQEDFENGELSEQVSFMLKALGSATSIYNLRTLMNPGTKLEILKGDRKGQVSLRVNDQYRLCFYWVSGEGAFEIELVDYH